MEYDGDDDDVVPLETSVRSSTRTRRPNRRVFGDEWANHTVQLTPSSRTFLGHIIPSLSHDDLFLHSLDWDAPFSEDYGSYHGLNLLHVTTMKSIGLIPLLSLPRLAARAHQLFARNPTVVSRRNRSLVRRHGCRTSSAPGQENDDRDQSLRRPKRKVNRQIHMGVQTQTTSKWRNL